MKRKIIVTLLIAALCTSMTACAESNPDGTTDVPQTTAGSSQTDTEATETVAEETTVSSELERLKNLAEFTYTFENCSYKDQLLNQPMPEFLDDEQKALFAKAEHFMQNMTTNTSFGIPYNPDEALTVTDDDGNERTYYPSGISCPSFWEYMSTTFMGIAQQKIMLNDDFYKNINGELYFTDGAR